MSRKEWVCSGIAGRARGRELVGAEMASWVVYVSVFAGWLYVAGVGRRWWDHPWAKYILETDPGLLGTPE
jgi:hypothetical protein